MHESYFIIIIIIIIIILQEIQSNVPVSFLAPRPAVPTFPEHFVLLTPGTLQCAQWPLAVAGCCSGVTKRAGGDGIVARTHGLLLLLH
jgi:hypothetical protein